MGRGRIFFTDYNEQWKTIKNKPFTYIGKYSIPMDGMGILKPVLPWFRFVLGWTFPWKSFPKFSRFRSGNIFPDAYNNRWPDPVPFYIFAAMIKEMNSQVVASGFISVILATLLPLFFGPKRVVQNSHSSLPAILRSWPLFGAGYTLEKTKIDTKNDGLEDLSSFKHGCFW